MKSCYIDVETSGTDPNKHSILQLAAIVEAGGKRRTFKTTIAPFPKDLVDPRALNVNNFTEEQIRGFTTPRVAYANFKSFLSTFVDPYDKQDKFFFIGYNSHSFDMPFVRRFFEKNGDKFFGSFFFYPSIDVMILAIQVLREERSKMKNFKLFTVAEALGVSVEEDKLHDALYDIELTERVYKKIGDFSK